MGSLQPFVLISNDVLDCFAAGRFGHGIDLSLFSKSSGAGTAGSGSILHVSLDTAKLGENIS